MANFNIIDEYKEVSIEEVMNLTGLPNPYTDQSKYSLARQKELLLKEARRQNILHLVKKSNPRSILSRGIIVDKDLVIDYITDKGERKAFTSKINLNLIRHKVIEGTTNPTIIIKQKDLPSHIVRSPKKGSCYTLVIGTKEHKFYFKESLYKKGDLIGTSFKTYGLNTIFNLVIN